MGLWYWGPDFPDPSNYLAFAPGGLIGLRADWPATAAPATRRGGHQAAARSADDGPAGRPVPAVPAGPQRLRPVHPARAAALEHRHGDVGHRRRVQPDLDDRCRRHRRQVAPTGSSDGRGTDAARRAGHPLVRYLLRRIGVSVLLVVGVTLVTFVLTNLVPGDPVAANLGQQAAADPAIVAAVPRPLRPRQAAAGAVRSPTSATSCTATSASPSRRHRSVVADLSAAVPATLEIAIGAIVLSILIGVGFGVVAAVRRGHLADSALRVVSAGGHLRADVLAGAGRVLRLLLPARHRPGLGAALARRHRATRRHRPLHGRLPARRAVGGVRRRGRAPGAARRWC